jgi:hypothetical protein
VHSVVGRKRELYSTILAQARAEVAKRAFRTKAEGGQYTRKSARLEPKWLCTGGKPNAPVTVAGVERAAAAETQSRGPNNDHVGSVLRVGRGEGKLSPSPPAYAVHRCTDHWARLHLDSTPFPRRLPLWWAGTDRRWERGTTTSPATQRAADDAPVVPRTQWRSVSRVRAVSSGSIPQQGRFAEGPGGTHTHTHRDENAAAFRQCSCCSSWCSAVGALCSCQHGYAHCHVPSLIAPPLGTTNPRIALLAHYPSHRKTTAIPTIPSILYPSVLAPFPETVAIPTIPSILYPGRVRFLETAAIPAIPSILYPGRGLLERALSQLSRLSLIPAAFASLRRALSRLSRLSFIPSGSCTSRVGIRDSWDSRDRAPRKRTRPG